MACAVEVAEPVRKSISAPKMSLHDLQDMLDAMECQGADKELLEQVARTHLARICAAY